MDYSAAVFPVGKVEVGDTRTNFPRSKEMLGAEDTLFESLYEGPGQYADAPVALLTHLWHCSLWEGGTEKKRS